MSRNFQPKWHDLESDRYASRKHGGRPSGLHSLIPTRRTTPVIGIVVIFIFIFTYSYYSHTSHVTSTDHLMPVQTKPAVEKTGGKFAIVTFETRDVTFWRESLGNKFEYTQRHGYEFLPTFKSPKGDDMGGVWSKIPLVNQTLAMGRFEWVLWMDFDTLFTNLHHKMEDFMEDAQTNHLNALQTGQKWSDVSMIASADCQPFNAGVMFFRNTAWTRQFLEKVWAMRNEPRKSEQDCMRIVLDNDGELDKGNKHFLLVPQYKLNSYPDELSCVENHERHWKQGDWIIHFPGAWAFMRDTKDPFGDLLRRYYPRIIY